MSTIIGFNINYSASTIILKTVLQLSGHLSDLEKEDLCLQKRIASVDIWVATIVLSSYTSMAVRRFPCNWYLCLCDYSVLFFRNFLLQF